MENRLSFRLAEYLFKNAFPIYKFLYRIFKNRQDALEIAYLKNEIKPGDTVLDIGSNIGFYTTIISDLTGDKGMVHGFEPDQKNFKHLKATVAGRSNVKITNAAVSDKSGKLEIFTSHRLNVDHRTYRPEKFDSSYFVDAVSIDEYLSKNKKVDFIKIDIQGAELYAFKGMQEILKANKGLRMLTEFWPYGLKSAGSSAEELLQFMSNLGYTAYLLNDKGMLAELNDANITSVGTGEEDYCNVVFKN